MITKEPPAPVCVGSRPKAGVQDDEDYLTIHRSAPLGPLLRTEAPRPFLTSNLQKGYILVTISPWDEFVFGRLQVLRWGLVV
jgi:hypothetical protein